MKDESRCNQSFAERTFVTDIRRRLRTYWPDMSNYANRAMPPLRAYSLGYAVFDYKRHASRPADGTPCSHAAAGARRRKISSRYKWTGRVKRVCVKRVCVKFVKFKCSVVWRFDVESSK